MGGCLSRDAPDTGVGHSASQKSAHQVDAAVASTSAAKLAVHEQNHVVTSGSIKVDIVKPAVHTLYAGSTKPSEKFGVQPDVTQPSSSNTPSSQPATTTTTTTTTPAPTTSAQPPSGGVPLASTSSSKTLTHETGDPSPTADNDSPARAKAKANHRVMWREDVKLEDSSKDKDKDKDEETQDTLQKPKRTHSLPHTWRPCDPNSQLTPRASTESQLSEQLSSSLASEDSHTQEEDGAVNPEEGEGEGDPSGGAQGPPSGGRRRPPQRSISSGRLLSHPSRFVIEALQQEDPAVVQELVQAPAARRPPAAPTHRRRVKRSATERSLHQKAVLSAQHQQLLSNASQFGWPGM